MMTVIHYKALLDVLGPIAFDTLIADKGLSVVGFNPGQGTKEHALVASGLYQRVQIPVGESDPTQFLIAGDRVYFMNHDLMRYCNPTSVWLGEHAIYIGNGMFTGFGIGVAVSYKDLIQFMRNALKDACDKTQVRDHMSTIEEQDIPGLRHEPVASKTHLYVTKVYRLSPERLRRYISLKFAKSSRH